jgi:DNA-binding IclR family transcriptional regulator
MILELFSDRRPALTMGEIAELTELNRATVYRFCQTLLQLGYLEDAGDRRLRPGLKAVSLARAALSSHELPDLALPHLRRLRRETGETVNMALLDGAHVVYVSRLLSDDLLALRLFVGSRLPAYASSLGRAILAYLPEDEVQELIDQLPLQPLTEYTIVNRAQLLAELQRVRRRGYAINNQEFVLGIFGIAAPIFDVSGRPVAAINLSLARVPKRSEIESTLAPQVVEAAAAVSELATQLAVDVAGPSRLLQQGWR